MESGAGVGAGRVAHRPDRPRLLVVASDTASDLCRLFAARGFVVTAQQPGGIDVRGARAEITIIDFQAPGAVRALDQVVRLDRRPVLIGIAPVSGSALLEDRLDAFFARPVDPARLFARAVILLGERRQQGDQGRRRISGVVGVVRGNPLFERVRTELHAAVSPVNAGAVLEQVLVELGSTPASATEIDMEAVVVSGRLLHALAGFGERDAVLATLIKIQEFLDGG